MSGNLKHIALDWLLRIQQSPEDADLRTGLATWLAADQSHVDAYRQAEKVWRLTAMVQPTMQAVPAPAKVEQFVAPARPRRTRRRWPALAAGALAACLVLFIAPDAWLTYQSDYRTALGQQHVVELEDGSRVHLDSDSAIAVRYDDAHREVRLLSGQAFFEVTSDKTRPFQVDAKALQVTVTGTAFNVSIRPSQLAVAVRHGSVRVSEGENVLATALISGDRLRWLGSDQQVLRDKLPVSQIAAWQKGQLVVRDAPISEVLEELGRYLPGTVTLRDQQLGQQRVTGVYDLRNPDAALRAVVQPYQGKVSTWSGWLRVVERQP